MNDKKYTINWIQEKLVTEHFKPPFTLYDTYQATVKNISFTYPTSWYEGINVWNELNGQPINYEFGYVGTNGWETDPSSPIGLWFFVGEIPMPVVCNKDAILTDIVSMTPVKIKGLAQSVYYCETIASPMYDKSKFIANSGLISVHSAKPSTRFSMKEYLKCHPLTDDWYVYDPANQQKVLFQFSARSFGLVASEADQAFSSKSDALNFFTSSFYTQAKQIVLSTTVG
ncbi:MAG TPA: hypothetical protein VLG36_01445 [Candidatus Chromulinivoraceae bacterium]|nr:hypothetical protein [Candidatus Chromulinivoraceae bacterium]